MCGLMEVQLLGKKHYFCILVNDRSQFLWFQPCTWFIKLDMMFANHYGTHIKILCTDQGGEYVNSILETYCMQNGIVIELTVLHTPEQNGVAERANWRILDKGHTLLKDSGAPNYLWANAFTTAIYAINQTVSSSIGTPHHMRPFLGGSQTYLTCACGMQTYLLTSQRT